MKLKKSSIAVACFLPDTAKELISTLVQAYRHFGCTPEVVLDIPNFTVSHPRRRQAVVTVLMATDSVHFIVMCSLPCCLYKEPVTAHATPAIGDARRCKQNAATLWVTWPQPTGVTSTARLCDLVVQ